MKATALIAALQSMVAKHGDIPCVITVPGPNGYGHGEVGRLYPTFYDPSEGPFPEDYEPVFELQVDD